MTRVHDRWAVGVLLLGVATLLVVTLTRHSIPLYGVETDLLGDTVPAARALRQGAITPETFQFRGPGYALMIAAGARLTGGDEFLAARILNVMAAAAAATAAWLMFRAFLGSLAGLAVLAGLLASPVFVRGTIEAGSDLPAMGLGLMATWLAVRPGGWRAAAGAGLLAAAAYLTRYNMVFLAPAGFGALLLARADTRRLVALVLGFAIPALAWVGAHVAATGEPPRNQNFLNVAYEVYGRGMGYERFWVQTGSAFGSFADVALHDPARFALHIGRNVATRWLADAHQLMPVWIGALALPGMLIVWWRRPGAAALALHAAGAYLVLTLVFYVPRFFLYLLPFYLSGVFGLLLAALREAPGAGGWTRVLPPWFRLAGPGIAAALIALSALAAVEETRRILADPPGETRIAGELLRGIAAPGERVMARKPHVAWFAGLSYVPVPYEERFTDFLAAADRARADYLFVSAIETAQHPQLSVLADPGVALPGLVPLAHRVLGGSHYFALYRRVPTDVPPAAVEDSLLGAIVRFAARRPGDPWPLTYLGGQLVTMGRHREALGPLAEAARLDPRDALIARFQTIAHTELGDYERAAAACERALALAPSGTWEWGYLGRIRIAQGRYAEARAALRRAIDGEPANPRYPALYDEATRLEDSLRRTRPAARP